jgi:DNA sulfur modification protein DndD
MRLLRTRIENFRLLKDIELDFSTDSDRNLTIIRAANESGKTTLLTALQWGLFGDDALPNRGKNFRLSPMDLSSSERASATITVEIDYELTPDDVRRYRLIRTVTENVLNGEWKRGSTSANLLQLTSKGANRVNNPEAHIRPYLPRELREVFFTDGDRALSFIEGSKGEQVKRVEGAIRSLLGLRVLEEALGHTHIVSTELNRKVKNVAGNREELQEISDLLSSYQEKMPILETELQKHKEDGLRLEELENEADHKLSDALRHGNREELEKKRQLA